MNVHLLTVTFVTLIMLVKCLHILLHTFLSNVCMCNKIILFSIKTFWFFIHRTQNLFLYPVYHSDQIPFLIIRKQCFLISWKDISECKAHLLESLWFYNFCVQVLITCKLHLQILVKKLCKKCTISLISWDSGWLWLKKSIDIMQWYQTKLPLTHI